MEVVTLVLVASGLVVAALGLPMWAKWLSPNRIYGFRTPLTLTNPEVWYEANRLAGRDLVIGGVAMALVSLLSAPFVQGPGAPSPLLVFAPFVPLVLAVLHSFWATSAWLADRKDRHGDGASTTEAREERSPEAPRRRDPDRQRSSE